MISIRKLIMVTLPHSATETHFMQPPGAQSRLMNSANWATDSNRGSNSRGLNETRLYSSL